MWKVITSSDPSWNEYLNKMPNYLNDVYFKSEYYVLNKGGTGKGKLFIYEENDKFNINQ